MVQTMTELIFRLCVYNSFELYVNYKLNCEEFMRSYATPNALSVVFLTITLRIYIRYFLLYDH